jgi:hypothetical protein
MQRYILTHNEESAPVSVILEYAPEGWDDLKYTLTRNEMYHGLFIDFSGDLRFPKDGKQFIDDVLDTYGYEVEVKIEIKEFNQQSRAFESKINGVLVFDPETYERTELFTSVSFIGSTVHRKFKNREDLEVAYNRKESQEGVILPGFTNDFVNVVLRGVDGVETTARAVYPFEAFTRVLQIICDLDYNCVTSSVLGRTDYDYVDDGVFSKVMLSNGLLMRGWMEAGDVLQEGYTNLNFKFRELFETFSKVFNLGLGLIYDNENKRWQFTIDRRNFFYQTSTILTISQYNISNMRVKYGKEFMYNRIETGYSKYVDENEYGLIEYNNESQFSTPISITDNVLDLRVPYRADGLGFQVAIDNAKVDDSSSSATGENTNDTNIDDDIFLIDSIFEEGVLKSAFDEYIGFLDGLYSDYQLKANIRLTPARNMVRWGDWINAALGKLQDRNLRFEKAKKLTSLQSRIDGETDTIYETQDYPVSNLLEPRWSGRVFEFDAPLTRDQINAIIDNPYGLVKFYNYIDKEWGQGWIKECSTDRVDRETTWQLYEAINLEVTANNLVYVEGDDVPISLIDGSGVIKTDV